MELDKQTSSLKAVLEEQNQQLKAAKEHGMQMEEQAGSAQAQVGRKRVQVQVKKVHAALPATQQGCPLIPALGTKKSKEGMVCLQHDRRGSCGWAQVPGYLAAG